MVLHCYHEFQDTIFTSYAANSNNKVAAFLSPAELNLGLGMSYQYKNDKKRFETSISLSPLSYNLQFIVNDDMDAASFGIKSGKSMSQYGSSFEGRIKWEFYHNMVWSCRLFYFTNYDHVQGDMEIHSTLSSTVSSLLVYLFICDMTMLAR